MSNSPDSTQLAEEYLSRDAAADGAERFATAEQVDVAVEGGTVRVFRVPGSGNDRPVVFIPGWGAVHETFGDFYSALSPRTEVFHVETREKSSSRIERRTAQFSMDHFAHDVRRVMDHFAIHDRDPVLMGTCFGSAILLHGLAGGILDARSVVCVDPMVKLWMPRWIIRVAGPILPSFGLWLLRPLIRAAILAGMREPVQRDRARKFINSSTVWKWRRAAIHVRDWSLFDLTHEVHAQVHVLNGSHDRFHNSDLFPRVAQALKNGVLVQMVVGESRRERLMGVTASLFASLSSDEGTPAALRPFATIP